MGFSTTFNPNGAADKNPVIKMNRWELDNVRRMAQGTPRPVIYGGAAAAEEDYKFYLRNTTTETIPANTFISAALVWDIEPWYVRYVDEVYSSTTGLFGTLWSQEWSPANSPYDQLLYNVLTNHICYLRLHDWYANGGQHGDPAWLEETWGNMYARSGNATGLGTQKWGWSKESPINAPGRFYCKTAIEPSMQGEIYFVDNVRPVYYAQADAANTATVYGTNPLNIRNEKNQHALRGSRWGARYIPRFLRNSGVVSQFWRYPDGEYTGSASQGPTSSYQSWVQSYCEFDTAYGLSTDLLVASIPAPIVENEGSSTTQDYTDITDFWTQDVLIASNKIVYNDPYLWDGYRGAAQSTSGKHFPARVLGLACPCYNFTSPIGGVLHGATQSSPTIREGAGELYAPAATSGLIGSFCCGRFGGVFNVIPAATSTWAPTSGDTDAAYFRAIASPVTTIANNHYNPESVGTKIYLEPVYPSTRFIEKKDNSATAGTDYLKGTLLDLDYNVTTAAAGNAVWVVCYSMGSTSYGESGCFTVNGDKYFPLIIKSVNERYAIF